MSATETGTGTARNTNPVDALRRMSNAYFERSPVNAEWARDGHEDR